jgi:hypothetical protein
MYLSAFGVEKVSEHHMFNVRHLQGKMLKKVKFLAHKNAGDVNLEL